VTDWEAGDLASLTLTVDPADTDTAATATATSPLGTVSTPTLATADSGITWTGTLAVDVAGLWLVRYVVTGTGAGVQTTELRVAPTPGVSGRVYATTEDYANWLQAAPPTGSRRALAAASRTVDRALLTALYATDDDGYPTDDAIAEALLSATCAQAEHARSVGDPYGLGRVPVQQASIGGASFSRAQSPGTQATGRDLGPAAYDVLQQAGLTGQEPWTW
jgi:hypothetical protein